MGFGCGPLDIGRGGLFCCTSHIARYLSETLFIDQQLLSLAISKFLFYLIDG